jgi:hypothetical protein
MAVKCSRCSVRDADPDSTQEMCASCALMFLRQKYDALLGLFSDMQVARGPTAQKSPLHRKPFLRVVPPLGGIVAIAFAWKRLVIPAAAVLAGAAITTAAVTAPMVIHNSAKPHAPRRRPIVLVPIGSSPFKPIRASAPLVTGQGMFDPPPNPAPNPTADATTLPTPTPTVAPTTPPSVNPSPSNAAPTTPPPTPDQSQVPDPPTPSPSDSG